MPNAENLCTKSVCRAGCCSNNVLHGLDPDKTFEWLHELPSYSGITSKEQLDAVKHAISDKKHSPETTGSVSYALTSEGLEVYIAGLCPSNTGAPLFDCTAVNRPSACESVEFNGFSCIFKRRTY